MPMGMIISSVKMGWKGGKGGVGTSEVVEVEQLRLLIVAMVGREHMGVNFIFTSFFNLLNYYNLSYSLHCHFSYLHKSYHKFRYHCNSPRTTSVRLLCLKSLLSL